jgi:hypothetical protein
MAKTGVLGNGPISFFIAVTRSQVSIPLSVLIFDGGALTVSSTAGRDDLTALLGSGLSQWLAYQASQGYVVPAPTAPAGQALVFKAVDAGVTGNDVTVEIVYAAGTPRKYTATVTKTDNYTGLTKDTIEGVLGKVASPIPGTQPGLVQVKDKTAFSGPVDATQGPVGPVVGATEAAAIKFALGPSNTLELAASRPGPDGMKLLVTLAVTDAPSGTFSLTATWTTAITIDTTALPAAWATAFLAAGYVLTVGAPASGTLGLPQAGVYVLSGGANAAPAATATATALAAQ